MKNLFPLVILCLTFLVTDLFAQQTRFDEANALLEENRYQDAVNQYKSIADDGYEAGALWLNMGIAYSQLDSLGMAKFYLLKAKQFSETEELADQALFYVNQRFSRQSAVLPPLPWDRFFRFLSERYGISALAYTSVFFLYAGIAFLIWSWFQHHFKKILRNTAFTLLGISALFLLLSGIIQYQENRYGVAVMVERQGPVFEQPRDEAPVVSTAFEGYQMRVDFKRSGEHPDWAYIRLDNGMYGWVNDDLLMVF